MQTDLLRFKNLNRGLSRAYFIMTKIVITLRGENDIFGNLMSDVKDGHLIGVVLMFTLVLAPSAAPCVMIPQKILLGKESVSNVLWKSMGGCSGNEF